MTSPQGYSRYVSDLRSFPAKVHQLPRLTIELTDRCNNNCQHCYINLPSHDPLAIKNEMKTGFVKDLILQAADLGSLDLRFTGGEPLLREDFPELYVFAREKGFKVVISTNARLITPRLIEIFKKIPPRQPIGITIYGMSEKNYDKVSAVRGSFEEFQRGVQLLLENRVDFELKMAVLPDNLSEVQAYENWLKKLFLGRQKPVYVVNFYKRARHDNPEKNRWIEELRGKPEECINLLARTDFYFKEMGDFCRQFSGVWGDKLFACGFGHSLCVDAYGFAQGCLLLRHPDLLFDLRTGTLAEALHVFFPKFFARHAQYPLFLQRCALCCLRGLCEQCPAHSWMENGTLDTPVEFQCWIAHAHARRLGLLAAGENGWEILDWQVRLDSLKKHR
jgi:MoaA/NifB/PqqE/SkfB family radical SAM enzyme